MSNPTLKISQETTKELSSMITIQPSSLGFQDVDVDFAALLCVITHALRDKISKRMDNFDAQDVRVREPDGFDCVCPHAFVVSCEFPFSIYHATNYRKCNCAFEAVLSLARRQQSGVVPKDIKVWNTCDQEYNANLADNTEFIAYLNQPDLVRLIKQYAMRDGTPTRDVFSNMILGTGQHKIKLETQVRDDIAATFNALAMYIDLQPTLPFIALVHGFGVEKAIHVLMISDPQEDSLDSWKASIESMDIQELEKLFVNYPAAGKVFTSLPARSWLYVDGLEELPFPCHAEFILSYNHRGFASADIAFRNRPVIRMRYGTPGVRVISRIDYGGNVYDSGPRFL